MSIRQLAKTLDLSITTVSRALAGYSDVSKATQERVKAAAKLAGYRPNAMARNLKMGRASTMGILLPVAAAGYGDPFIAELIASVSAALAEKDLDLVVTSVPSGETEVSAMQRVIDARKIDGFFIPRTRWDDPRVDLLLELDFPFVCHGRTARADEHAWLDVDGETAFLEATRRLISFGHRDIAMINAPASFTYARHRFAGYRKALAEAGIALREELVIEAKAARIDEGQSTAATLLEKQNPTAILAATDQLAIGVLSAIRAKGLQAGRDISVIGYDDLMLSAHTVPPLTTMRQAIANEGRELVELLLDRIAGKPVKELQKLWKADLVARASDGPLNSKKPTGEKS
ncbi:MAG: substrate-binding domain-containing protein [Beijerinckiaceae bacterium]